MVYRLVICILLFTSSAVWADDFSPKTRFLLGAATFAYIADGYSTIRFLDETDAKETNIFLGEHPSRPAVIGYIGGCIALTWLITFVLPEEYRQFFLFPVIGVEAKAAYKNFSIVYNF